MHSQQPWQLTVAVVLAFSTTINGQFTLKRTYDKQSNFFEQFFFRDAAYYKEIIGVTDPTHGFVNYLNSSEAKRTGLAVYQGDRVFLGADSTATIPPSANGRNSVRLESKDTFNSGLLIADIQHMPGNACGVWPAFWSFNFDENPYSEIDILEGNGWTSQHQNTVSLHTCGTCSFPNLTGTEVRKDCDLHADETCSNETNPSGCGLDGETGSFGDGFNTGGGGIYATLLDNTGIKIWFFRRSSIPADITSSKPNPAGWGKPMANFQSSGSCQVPSRFSKQTIIINIDFCGDIIYDWNEQTQGQCGASSGGTCDAYVAAHPEAYREAYWLFNSIKLYQ